MQNKEEKTEKVKAEAVVEVKEKGKSHEEKDRNKDGYLKENRR